jgi:hypothetical protein
MPIKLTVLSKIISDINYIIKFIKYSSLEINFIHGRNYLKGVVLNLM